MTNVLSYRRNRARRIAREHGLVPLDPRATSLVTIHAERAGDRVASMRAHPSNYAGPAA